MYTALPFPRVLTIAGSDSGGGAGIQADVKTISALGGYAASAVTAVTAQNTQGVQAVQVVSPQLIEAQCESVFADMRIDAVKIGMLADVASIRMVAAVLQRHRLPFTVLDPVLVATSGDSLALEDTAAAMCDILLPWADVVTPNLNELACLAGQTLAADEAQMRAQGRLLCGRGARAVLLKGGHWYHRTDANDWLLTADGSVHCFAAERIATRHTHGTGCTLSSAIAVLRPQHDSLPAAVAAAKDYLNGALIEGSRWQLGQGSGPLAHFWQGRPNHGFGDGAE